MCRRRLAQSRILELIKKERAFDMTKNSLNFPVDGKPLLLPEKDKSSRTKHLSHLPNVRIAAQNPTSRPKSHSRSYSHSSSTPSATLVRLLRAQESTTKETKALLNVALSQLDSASARAAKAEAQISARETASLLSHTQLTENAARAEEAASRARREAQNYKLQLWLKDEEIRKERERVRAEEHMRAEAEKEAERARSLARKWRGEGRILKAKEEGRREGYGEGLKRGRLVIAAAVAASESGYGDRRLVGDGAAYIEEYDDAPFNQPRRRREQSRSRGTRSRKSEPGSTAPPSRRERVDPSFTRPSPSEMVQYQSPPPAEPVQEPIQEPPPPSISESSSIIRRARSIQVDSPLFQPERTNSALSSRSRQLQTVVLSPPENHPTQTQIFVHESPPPPLPPPVFPEPAPTIPEPEPEVYTFPTPDVPLILEQQQPPDSTPIPIPPPISQVPFAPGILPTAPSTFPHHAQYAAPKPEPQPPFQPTYFPMPAPPVQVIITPAEEDRDVQTPSTMTSMTNENSLNGLGFLSDFPAVTSVAGSAVSVGSGGSTGLNRADGGRFDPDFLSTIHEHSREGTAFGGEEDGTARGMSPRYVDQWRRSLGGQPYSPGGNSGNDLLRPPSSTSNPNSRRRRPSALNLDVELDRQLSSGSTSSRSININVEPPSRPTSPSSDPRNHQNDRFHRGDQDYHYGYTENEHPPQDEAFLSPHHAPLTLSAEHDEGPVIPSIKEESDEDDYDDHDYPNSRSLNSGSSSPVQLYPLSIVDSLPPGFVPTPNGGHLISLQQQHKLRDGSHPGQIASVGYVSGIGGGGQPRGVPGGFYAHANNPNAHDQNGRHPYGVSSIRGDGDDYSRTGSSSSRSSSAAGSSLSTELGRPNKYPRSKGGASNRRRSRALTSTFPPTTMSDGGYDSNKEYGNGDGNTLGGIYAMPAINPNSLNRGTLRDMSQYGSVGNVPAAAAIGGSSRMSMSMPEPSLPQYGHSSMPEPSVPQYPYNSEATRYSTPRGDTSRSVPMPEPAVPLYPSTGPSGSSLEGQRNIGLGAGGRQRSLKRTKGAVSRVGMDMPEPSVPQYRTSNARGYGTQSPGDSRGGSRMTPAAVSMPDPSVPQYNVPNQGYAGVYQTPGGDSRMIPPAVSMPEPTVTGYPANVHQTPGAANASSRITPAAMPMPEPNVLPQHDQYPTYGMPGYHTPTPGGGTAGASRMVSPEMSMPEPSVGSSTVAGTGVPADGTSRMTAPAMIMPEPSVDSTVSVKGITAGGTSRMTAPVVPMPNHSVGLAANGTPAREVCRG
ncbi:hypothetical protein DFH05DRAFT_997347 [Lentinula detonsa]|uniref:Uncharacterized protein n=1 Tax=Lentinula detonsa TaxID=2804962 RepID=A0A9W8P1X5_9AGAR|nr:hypothetical protein DFH05DRAFT_997347 [Lentinula detonsa]